MLGYPVDTTDMEELEVPGHGRAIPLAGVSFFVTLISAIKFVVMFPTIPTGSYGHSLLPFWAYMR